MRRGLIVSQVFFGSFFLFVALSLYKQFHFTQYKDKGINVENIIQINPGGWTGFERYPTLKTELLRSPHIEDVSFTTTPIISELGEWYYSYTTRMLVDEKEYSNVWAFMVEPNFLEFFGMKMKSGEWISGETDIVINQVQTQVFDGNNPIGQHIRIGGFGE